MKLYYFVLLILCSVYLFNPTCVQAQFPTGKIVDTVTCQKNAEHKYCLYLPSNYTQDKKWPVLFIYDAASRGKLVVERYQKAAETHGYILVGSYNFRNGPMEQAIEAANQLFEDVPQRFSVDTKRYYTSGLSGGGRMAASMGKLVKQITGVIACAAGYNTAYPHAKKDDFIFVSVVGIQDMNYHELLVTHQELDQDQELNKRVEFHGKHEWAPPNVLLKALTWMEVLSMKKGIIAKDDQKIKTFLSSELSYADSLMKKEAFVEAHRVYIDLIKNFDNWLDLKAVKAHKVALENRKELKKQQKAVEKIFDQEEKLQSMFFEAFGQVERVHNDSTLYWWGSQLKFLRKKLEKKEGTEEALMAYRQIGFISLGTFTRGLGYLRQRKMDKSIRYFEIWTMIKPEHPQMKYLMAKLYALGNQESRAIEAFQAAKKLGFTEHAKLSNEKLLEQLKSVTEFRSIFMEVSKDIL